MSNNLVTKRSAAIRKGVPDALDLLVICAEAGLTVDAAFARVARELGQAYPELGEEFQLTSIELGFLTERRMAFENLAERVKLDALEGRGHDHDPDREIRYAAGLGPARPLGRVPPRAHDARRGKGRAPARDHDRAADPLHPADPVRRYPGSGGLLDQRSLQVKPRPARVLPEPKSRSVRLRKGVAFAKEHPRISGKDVL